MDVIPSALASWFRECPYALTAFSGGVDSSLVAWLARHYLGRERHQAVISASPSLKLSDLDAAKSFAARHDIPLTIIETRELSNPDYFLNPVNRCFFCKHTLYSELEDLARTKSPCWILNGTNTDDLGDYRPGLQAAEKFQVRSPLAECGLNKQDIRDIAESLKLECWDKPASPCLSSRIPYGQRVTPEKLRRIEQAESWLQENGFNICRVRHIDESTARIEVPEEQVEKLKALETAIDQAFMPMGFTSVELDDEGFISGKLNRVLNPS
jgi:uncharacterized protein